MISLIDRLLDVRVHARQLAVARVLIGLGALLMSLEAWRMLTRFLRPAIVRIPFLPWLPVLPSSALPGFLTVWVLAALAFVAGWRTRAAGAVLTVLTAYTLFLDQQTYSNHLYLLVLVLLLLTISDCGAAWSLDARHGGRSEVPAWPVLLLKIQVSIVYCFSALAKITPRYLSGEVLALSLKQEGWSAVPEAWRTPAVLAALAAASIVVELFIAFALWSRRLRLSAVVAGIGFHLAILAIVDSSRLSLTVFALSVFAAYVLFLDPALQARRIGRTAVTT